MKANELMLGDWVKNKYGVAKVIYIGSYNGIYTDNPVNGEALFMAEELQPIPITQEILEKNGFEKCFLGGEAWRKNFQINNGVLVCIDGRDGGIMHFGYMGYDSKIPLHYVHELQHALRLCGIDKEIKL